MVDYSKLARIYNIPHIDINICEGESIEECASRILNIRNQLKEEIENSPKNYTPISEYAHIEINANSDGDWVYYTLDCYRLKTKQELLDDKKRKLKQEKAEKARKQREAKKEQKNDYKTYLRIKKELEENPEKYKSFQNEIRSNKNR